jgi:hypothetical protein
MLQVFYLDVIKVDLNVAYISMAIHACFKCFICFRHMLQIFCLDVSKIDLVLHMLQWHRWLAGSGLPQLPAAAGAPWVTVRAPAPLQRASTYRSR